MAHEKVFPLSKASAFLPSSRLNKPVSLSCLHRWVLDGVKLADGRRVRLEALRLGGRWVTSLEAIQRFAEAQTPTLGNDQQPHSRTSKKRMTAAQRAERE